MKLTRLCGVLAAGAPMFLAGAQAAPITHFTNSLSLVNADSHVCSTLECVRDPAYYGKQFSDTGAALSTSRAFDFTEGSASAASSANLATGELKALSQVTANGADGALTAFARADMGDSFLTTTNEGGPFNWASDTEVSFSFDISGLADMAGAVNSSMLVLNIFAPGDLDAEAQFFAGGSQTPPEALFSFAYSLGLGAMEYDFTGAVTSFPGTVTASFTPGGDFDWVLSLITDVSLDTGAYPNGFGLSDFANTVVASYAAPEGAVTYSASGLFPGTLALADAPSEVPVPAALPLMLSGLAGLGLAKRRRRG